jgi:hypothetical protein
MKVNKKKISCSKLKKEECKNNDDLCKWELSKCKKVVKDVKNIDTKCYKLKKADCKNQPVCVWDKHCKNMVPKPVTKEIEKDETKKSILSERKPRVPTKLGMQTQQALNRLRLKMAIRRAIRPLVNNDYSYNMRMKRLNIVDKFVTNLPDCIKYQDGEYRLGEELDVSQQIGSPSIYGAVFLSKGTGFGRLVKVAIKIAEDNENNRKEIEMLEKIKHLVVSGLTPNLPIMYGSRSCHVKVCKSNKIKCPSNLLKKPHLVVVNELATGDLKQWLSRASTARRPLEQYVSALCQIYMGLIVFNKHTGLIHNDMHWGNALYHSVPKGGWWHYKCKDKDIYLENTGQLWVLWDFGLVKNVENPFEYVPEKQVWVSRVDYYRIIHAFISEANGGWLKNPIHSDVENMGISVMNRIWETAVDYQNWFNILKIFKLLSELTENKKGIIYGKENAPSNILNNQPFIIV